MNATLRRWKNSLRQAARPPPGGGGEVGPNDNGNMGGSKLRALEKIPSKADAGTWGPVWNVSTQRGQSHGRPNICGTQERAGSQGKYRGVMNEAPGREAQGESRSSKGAGEPTPNAQLCSVEGSRRALHVEDTMERVVTGRRGGARKGAGGQTTRARSRSPEGAGKQGRWRRKPA